MKRETKQRLAVVVDLGKTVFHYGYIPLIVYLGFKRGPDVGAPPFSLLSIFMVG